MDWSDCGHGVSVYDSQTKDKKDVRFAIVVFVLCIALRRPIWHSTSLAGSLGIKLSEAY